MTLSNLKKRTYTSIFLLLFLYLFYSYKPMFLFGLIVFGIVSLLEFFNLSKKIFVNKFLSLISNLFFILFIFLFCIFFFLFSNFEEFKTLSFIILLTCVFSDIGGYIFGNIFKGPKLSKISPKKTIAGALGSIISSSFILSLMIFYLIKFFSLKIIFLGILISSACQIGDLFFSFLKRKAKIKDTGNFLPGHGGVLDRLDGIFFGWPVGLISFFIIN